MALEWISHRGRRLWLLIHRRVFLVRSIFERVSVGSDNLFPARALLSRAALMLDHRLDHPGVVIQERDLQPKVFDNRAGVLFAHAPELGATALARLLLGTGDRGRGRRILGRLRDNGGPRIQARDLGIDDRAEAQETLAFRRRVAGGVRDDPRERGARALQRDPEGRCG